MRDPESQPFPCFFSCSLPHQEHMPNCSETLLCIKAAGLVGLAGASDLWVAPGSALEMGVSGDGTPCLPLMSLLGARTQPMGSQVPGTE